MDLTLRFILVAFEGALEKFIIFLLCRLDITIPIDFLNSLPGSLSHLFLDPLLRGVLLILVAVVALSMLGKKILAVESLVTDSTLIRPISE